MKKNQLFTGIVMVLAASQMLTACSSEDANISSANMASQGNAISLTSALRSSSRRVAADPQTTQLNTAVKVGAFGVSGNATITNGNNNQYSVETNGNLTTTTEMTWPTEGNVNIYAYAPYQSGWTYNAANAFAVATNQTDAAGYLASDLVYGTPASNPVAQTSETITLGFTHKLAKLNITIQQAEDSQLDLSTASVTIMNTKVATTFNPSTGEVGEATGDAADIQVISALGTDRTACAIMVPQQVAAGTQLVKIVAGSKQLLAKLGTATTFVGGKSYNFTVKVGNVTEPVTEVTLQLGSTTIVGWDDEDMGQADADGKKYATFGTPGNNATYSAENFTYTWTGSTSNLMTCFEFANGELANYSKLVFTFSNLVDGPVRMGYYVGSTFTEFGNGYYNAGTKTVDLTALNIDLSTVTKIAFGGRSNAGSCVIKASEMYLE